MTGRRPRRVLHADVDAFFAGAECVDDPSLQGQPLAVGGVGPRSVVSSCSYEARVFGVRSAMPMGEARRLCPGLVVRPPRFGRYGELSTELMARLARVSPVIESVALDEAYVDVSDLDRDHDGLATLARGLRSSIRADLGLDVSFGLAPNKLVAKLASEAAKPIVRGSEILTGAGVVSIEAQEVASFLAGRSVRELHGVGPATASRLARVAIETVEDVLSAPADVLRTAIGPRAARALEEAVRGIDERPVSSQRASRSIGVEQTYPWDLSSEGEVRARLGELAVDLAGRLRAHDVAASTLSLKVRYADFSTISRSRTVEHPLLASTDIRELATRWLAELDMEAGVRLLGLSCTGLVPAGAQLSLLGGLALAVPAAAESVSVPPDGATRAAAEEAGDAVRARFGSSALGWRHRQ